MMHEKIGCYGIVVVITRGWKTWYLACVLKSLRISG